MSRRRFFPVYVARTYPGGQHCGHQHTIAAAKNCAANLAAKPGFSGRVYVERVLKDGSTKIVVSQ